MLATKPPSPAQRLADLKARQALHRAGAMVPVRHPVAGGRIIIEPLTLRRWGLLVATDNALVTGRPISFDDLANFCWIHCAEFDQFNRAAKAQLTRTLYRWLTPRWPHLETALRLWATLPRLRRLRRWLGPDRAQRRRELVDLARQLITDAWAEMPEAPTDPDEPAGPGDALPCAFAAYLGTLFPHWPPDTLADLPLSTIAQHARALVVDRKGAQHLTLLTPEERKIWDDYLADPLGRRTSSS